MITKYFSVWIIARNKLRHWQYQDEPLFVFPHDKIKRETRFFSARKRVSIFYTALTRKSSNSKSVHATSSALWLREGEWRSFLNMYILPALFKKSTAPCCIARLNAKTNQIPKSPILQYLFSCLLVCMFCINNNEREKYENWLTIAAVSVTKPSTRIKLNTYFFEFLN